MKAKIAPLLLSASRMGAWFSKCISMAVPLSATHSEFDDMTDLSLYACRWLNVVCLELGWDVLEQRRLG